MRCSLLLLLLVVVITTHSALGFFSFSATRPLPQQRSLARALAASSTPNPESSSSSSSSTSTSSSRSSSSRDEYLRGFLAAATGAMTAAAAMDRVPRIAQAVSADDVDPDKPQTVQTYLEDIDKYNLKCPEFPKNLEWVNTGPLSIQKDLRGKVVLMDFWTYCCINCMHTLPILARLEKKYADKPFQVIGVHSAKFENEKDTRNIKEAIARYKIEHPVVNDKDMAMFTAVGVNSWPSLVLVGPRGNLLSIWPGEGNGEKVDSFIEGALAFYGEKGLLDNTPLKLSKPTSVRGGLVGSPLSYPGKLHVDPKQPRLFVSDSGNNRVLVLDRNTGGVLAAVGSATGEPGLEDGDFESARFSNPQGVCLSADGRVLYVCDTDAHAIRAIDLEKKVVSTLAGNGEQGFDYSGGKAGKAQYLSSPWDVVLKPSSSSLLVAMAGTHQIWEVEVPSGKARCYSGTGREAETNAGDRINSAWAQPSGLAVGGQMLYVADSESSTVRELNLEGAGKTRTLVGGALGTSLFAFGDKDGNGAKARLQHPLAVATVRGGSQVVVADSYNHKLKLVDPTQGSVKTLVGSGKPGLKDGKQGGQFWEPGGLASDPTDPDVVWVADTNNHAIRVFNVASNEVSTFALGKDVPKAEAGAGDGEGGKNGGGEQQAQRSILNRRRARVIDLGPVGRQGRIQLQVEVPSDLTFTATRTSEWQSLGVGAGGGAMTRGTINKESTNRGMAIVTIPATAAEGAVVEVESAVYFCEEDKGVCRTDGVVFKLQVTEGGPVKVVATHVVDKGQKSRVGPV